MTTPSHAASAPDAAASAPAQSSAITLEHCPYLDPVKADLKNIFFVDLEPWIGIPRWRRWWFVDWLWPNFYWDQILLYFAGLVGFAFGADCFIYADLGTDPLDVFALGWIHQTPAMTVGAAQAIFAAFCLLVWALWNRKLPIVSPFVTFAVCGTIIDLFMGEKYVRHANSAGGLNFSDWGTMIFGVVVCAYASALIIQSGIGIRSMDLVAITMVRKWKLPFFICKGFLEVLLLFVGWLMGGPLGVGTAFFLLFVGWMIQPLMILNVKLLRMPNYGLKKRVPGDPEEPEHNIFVLLAIRMKWYTPPQQPQAVPTSDETAAAAAAAAAEAPLQAVSPVSSSSSSSSSFASSSSASAQPAATESTELVAVSVV